jgi:hypothetical protein
MRKAAFTLCALVLIGPAFAQQAPTYKDGEDGVNRMRPGNHKPWKAGPEARKPGSKKVVAKKAGEKADAKNSLNPAKKPDKP